MADVLPLVENAKQLRLSHGLGLGDGRIRVAVNSVLDEVDGAAHCVPHPPHRDDFKQGSVVPLSAAGPVLS
jgi:hypothetical protein